VTPADAWSGSSATRTESSTSAANTVEATTANAATEAAQSSTSAANTVEATTANAATEAAQSSTSAANTVEATDSTAGGTSAAAEATAETSTNAAATERAATTANTATPKSSTAAAQSSTEALTTESRTHTAAAQSSTEALTTESRTHTAAAQSSSDAGATESTAAGPDATATGTTKAGATTTGSMTQTATPTPGPRRSSLYNVDLSTSSQTPGHADATVTVAFAAAAGVNIGDRLTLTLPGFANPDTTPVLTGADTDYSAVWDQDKQTLVLTRLSGALESHIPLRVSVAGFRLPRLLSGKALLALNDEQAAALALVNPAPSISSVEPEAGAIGFQAQLTIHGVNFRPSARVTVGDKPCLAVSLVREGSGLALTCTTQQTAGSNLAVGVTNSDDTVSNQVLLSFWNPSPVIVTTLAMSVVEFDHSDRAFRQTMAKLLKLNWLYQIYIVGVRPGSCVVDWRILDSESQPGASVSGPQRLQTAAEQGQLAGTGLGITSVTVGAKAYLVAAPGPESAPLEEEGGGHEWSTWQIAVMTLVCVMCACVCCGCCYVVFTQCRRHRRNKQTQTKLAQLATPQPISYATTLWPAKSARDDEYNTTRALRNKRPNRLQSPLGRLKGMWGSVVTPKTRQFLELWTASPQHYASMESADLRGGHPTLRMDESETPRGAAAGRRAAHLECTTPVLVTTPAGSLSAWRAPWADTTHRRLVAAKAEAAVAVPLNARQGLMQRTFAGDALGGDMQRTFAGDTPADHTAYHR